MADQKLPADLEKLTIGWIIRELQKDGYGTKKKVLRRIQEAGPDELLTLAVSINKRIELIIIGSEED